MCIRDRFLRASELEKANVAIGEWQPIQKSASYILNPIKSQADWNILKNFKLDDDTTWDTDFEGTVVLVDNFVGSGRQMSKLFREAGSPAGGSNAPNLPTFLAACPKATVKILIVAGFLGGVKKLRSLAKSLGRVKVYVGHLFDERDRCFSSESKILPAQQRDAFQGECRRIARDELGISKTYKYGFGNVQSLVVLRDDVPNNTLPIIWKKTDSWRPLFPADGMLPD